VLRQAVDRDRSRAVKYDRYSRILHTCISSGIVLQLLCAQLMRPLRPHHPPPDAVENIFFIIHQYNGFIVIILVGLRLMSLLDAGDEKERLFPCLTARGRQRFRQDLSHQLPLWRRGKLPPPEEKNMLAATVHGLGICLALGLGLSGLVLFMGTNRDGSMMQPIMLVHDFHEAMAILMWSFIIGHVGMALMHQLAGHRVLQGIFRG